MTEDSAPDTVDGGSSAETSKLDVKTSPDPLPANRNVVQDRIRTLLLSVTSKEQLEAVMDELSYNAERIRMLRESLPEGSKRTEVLNFATDILLDTWDCDPSKAGTMATLLSQTGKDWRPGKMIIQKLVDVCEKAILDGNSAMIAVVQPMAYALGALGQQKFYSEWLRTTTMEKDWRKADLKRNEEYYASKTDTPRENQLAAIERHLKDPNRTGLLRAHDIGLLYQMREEQLDDGLGSFDAEVVRTNNLLRETVDVLEANKQDKLVNFIRKHRTI